MRESTNWKTSWKLHLCKQEEQSTSSTDDPYSRSIYSLHVTLSLKMLLALLASSPFCSLEPQAYLAMTPFPAKACSKTSSQAAKVNLPASLSCLKGHSCQKCLSNYLLDLDLKMQKQFSSILSYFFSNERSRGLHCYIPFACCCCRCIFAGKTGSSM